MTFTPTVTCKIDSNNSSTAILGANAIFTGATTDCTLYSSIDISVYSDVASKLQGLEVQSSTDGTDSSWYTYFTFNVDAATQVYRSVNVQARYFRIKYTNGSNAQTTFRLQTTLGVQNPEIYQSQKQTFFV